MGLFGAAHGWGGGGREEEQKSHHTFLKFVTHIIFYNNETLPKEDKKYI